MSENSERFCICISDLKQDRNTKAALLSETKWQSGDVIKVKFLEGDESLQQRVRETAEAWTGPDMADLKFEWVDEGDARHPHRVRAGQRVVVLPRHGLQADSG